MAEKWQRTQDIYQVLQWSYRVNGRLTAEECNYVKQLNQWFQVLQAQKMEVDIDFANEMMKHLAKMMVSRL
ncbi:MAG: hypothetical protein J6S89_08335 [Paludibacteraceae bacterium]|nr:hypothetical protein [Paludibacteraceae bacterium]